MSMGFEHFEPIFGEANAEGLIPVSTPFLVYVHAQDSACLKIHVSNFRSNTWEAVLSVHQLEDMRDNIGIGGSWADFVDYVRASLNSDDVKLVFDQWSRSEVTTCAKLVAQKAKGMPRISISLAKLSASAATEAIASLSLTLFKSLKTAQSLLMKEQERSYQLTKLIAAEKEKNESVQIQLELFKKRPKLEKMNVSDKADASVSGLSSDTSGNGFQSFPDNPEKVTKQHVVPVYRRARRGKGVRLQDTEDQKDD